MQKRKFLTLAAALLAFAALTPPKAQAGVASQVPQVQRDVLKKGVNFTNWCQRYYGREQFKNLNYISDYELTALKNAGITYIRLPIEPSVIFNVNGDWSQPSTNLTSYLDPIINRLMSKGFAVIVDLHYTYRGDSSFDDKLYTNPTKRNELKNFWKNLALRYKNYDQNKLFYEVLNEPAWGDYLYKKSPDPNDYSGYNIGKVNWWNYQRELIASIRQSDTRHTIICGADGWNGSYPLADSLRDTTSLGAYNDARIVYNFHFYDPMEFTHQGFLHPAGTNYPSWNTNVTTIRPAIDNVFRAARDTGLNLPLMCNEFGANSAIIKAGPQDGGKAGQRWCSYLDRRQWLRDVRQLLESYNILWTVWGYEAEGFGMLIPPFSDGDITRVAPVNDGDYWNATQNYKVFQSLGLAYAYYVSPWAGQDIGYVLDREGTYSITGFNTTTGNTDAATFTVTGSGNGMWGKYDAFFFCHRTLTGNGSISARVANYTGTNIYNKSGIMMRDSLAPDAIGVYLSLKPDGGIEMNYRNATSGDTQWLAGGNGAKGVLLRLTRTGTSIKGEYSTNNGSSWITVGTVTLSMTRSQNYMGLSVSSNDQNAQNTVTYNTVRTTGAN
jgi:endoglucanase